MGDLGMQVSVRLFINIYPGCLVSATVFKLFPLCELSHFSTSVYRQWVPRDRNSSYNVIRGVIDKFVCFFHRIIIYGWIYIIFCHYHHQSIVNRKKTLKCKVRQTCDVTMTLMTSHVGDVVVKTLEDRCGWCTLSGYKCYSTSAIIVKFSDNIFT